jgi:hypothetical protein
VKRETPTGSGSGNESSDESKWYSSAAISIKVVPEQSRKVEYERERLAGNR